MRIAEQYRSLLLTLVLCVCCVVQTQGYGIQQYVEEFYPVATSAVYPMCVPLGSLAGPLMDYKAEYLRDPKDNRNYRSKRLFQIGESTLYQPIEKRILWNSALPSERRFASTSVYIATSEKNAFLAENCLQPLIVIRKAPPGGGQSTGEWLPLPDAWCFLVVLALMYGITRRKKMARRQI